MLGDEYRDAVPAYGNLEVEIDDEIGRRFPQLRDIVERYWERELTPEGEVRFARSAQDVARGAGLGSGHVSRLVKLASRATLKGIACPNCGRDRQAVNRTGYHDAIKHRAERVLCA